jgi:ankyrin repeat protein
MHAQGLNEEDHHGGTALHRAVLMGREDVVTALLGQGAEANKRDDKGRTPFQIALSAGHVGVLRVLVQHVGAEVLLEVDKEGQTALHKAAASTSPGDDVYMDPEDWDPTEMVAFLLEQGLDANRTDADGMTPLMLACETTQRGFQRQRVVSLLAQHMDVEALNLKNRRGSTALHLAADGEFGDKEVIRALLLAGADPTIKDKRRKTPRELAKRCCAERLAVFQVSKCT